VREALAKDTGLSVRVVQVKILSNTKLLQQKMTTFNHIHE
jgi:hypothetical protein